MIKPRENQIVSANEMVRKKKCILAEDCGVGKTIISLLACKKIGKPVSIVCPANAKKQWESDAKLVGFDNYEIVSWNKASKDLKKHKSEVLVIDEAHRIPDSIVKSDRGKAVILKARGMKYIFLLTATPSIHRPLDFYWLLKLCGVWATTRDNFRILFCGAEYSFFRVNGRRILLDKKPTHIDKLKKLFDKVKVKNSKRKVKVNYKFVEEVGYKEPTPKFDEVAKYRADLGDRKFEKFHKKLGRDGIYFTYHRDITLRLSEYLKCPYIIGGMTYKTKDKVIEEAKKVGKIVISLGAGGESINGLDYWSRCYFLEVSYSPLKDKQAYMRMVRSDKDKDIEVVYLLFDNEHTYAVNLKKKEYLEEIK